MIYQFDQDWASVEEHARELRRHGMQIVPALSPIAGQQWKRPSIKWSSYQADLVDQATFDLWFRGYKGTNIGLLTGRCSGHVFVCDLDYHKHPEAEAWWRSLLVVNNNSIEMQTPTQRTGGGGLQLLFRYPPNWRAPTCKTPIGVDIRGEGGFAVLAPSNHESGNAYEWLPDLAPWDITIMDAPQWLLDAVHDLEAKYTQRTAQSPSSTRRRDNSSEYPTTPFGRLLNGREGKMTSIVWNCVCNLYHESAIFKDDKANRIAGEEAYRRYLGSVASRLSLDQRVNLTDEEALEREGRGWTLFSEKWNRTIGLWDTKIREAVETDQHNHSQRNDGSSPSEERQDASTARETAQKQIASFFKDAKAMAIRIQCWKAAQAETASNMQPDDLQTPPTEPRIQAGLASVDVGLGKTEITIKCAVDFVSTDHEWDERSEKPLIPLMIEYITTDHKLASEITKRLNDLEPGVALHWQGLERESPDGHRMCLSFDDMAPWLAAGGKAATMCSTCPHRQNGGDQEPCAYQQQWNGEPIIVMAAPDGLTSNTTVGPLQRSLKVDGSRAQVPHHADLIIVDETRFQNWLGGFDG